MRTALRYIVTFLALVLGTGTLSPLIQANWQEWAKVKGHDQYLVRYGDPIMAGLTELAQNGLFVFFAGFFVGGAFFLWADYLFRRRSTPASTTTTNIGSGELAHGLYLERMHVGVDKTQKTVQIGFVLKNATDEPIRYEVEDITAVIEEKTVANPSFGNKGGVVARGASTTYFFAPIRHIIGNKIANAQASIVFKYGRATADTGFIREANYTTSVTIGPKGNAYVILEENDGAL